MQPNQPATLKLRRAACFQANAMPTQPNQQPAMGQRAPLSTHRVNSNIPGPSEGLTLALTLTVTLTVALTITVTVTVTITVTLVQASFVNFHGPSPQRRCSASF